MKTIILILIFSFTWVSLASPKVMKIERTIEWADDVNQTISEYKSVVAIAQVESNFREKVVNKKENAVGLMQIRLIMLKEVNRILGKEVYSDSCRFNALKSVEMFLVVQRAYNPSANLKVAALLWNTGTVTPKGNMGEVYWGKVKRMITP